MWLRSTWPSRGLSRLAVLLTTGCIAAACLAVTDPLIGIMGCAVHHPHRLHQRVPLGAAARDLLLAARLSGQDLVVGWCSIALIVMISGFLAVACATAIGLVNPPDRRGDDLEHVTGLLTLTGFYEHVATLIGARSPSAPPIATSLSRSPIWTATRCC